MIHFYTCGRGVCQTAEKEEVKQMSQYKGEERCYRRLFSNHFGFLFDKSGHDDDTLIIEISYKVTILSYHGHALYFLATSIETKTGKDF